MMRAKIIVRVNVVLSFVALLLVHTTLYAAPQRARRSAKKSVAEKPNVVERMKEIRLPSISFKPPATLPDAVEFFNQAVRDVGKRGDEANEREFKLEYKSTKGEGIVIPLIRASDITFYDALELVCTAVDHQFVVDGRIVYIIHKDDNPWLMRPRNPDEVPIADLPLEYKSAAEMFIRYFKKKNPERGRYVFGKIEIEGEVSIPVNEVVSMCYIEENGVFFGYSGRPKKSTAVTFSKFGYKSVSPFVAHANEAWRGDVAVNIGTVKLRKLKRNEGAVIRFTPRFPKGVEKGWANLGFGLDMRDIDIQDLAFIPSPPGINYSHVNCIQLDVTNGKRVEIRGCTPGHYGLELDYPTRDSSLLHYHNIDISRKKSISLGTIRVK